MPDFYDALETRAPEAREREQFSKLPGLIARAMSAPGWAEQLAGIDPKSVTSRAALAGLPVLRKSNLKERQRERPPLGGYAVTAPGQTQAPVDVTRPDLRARGSRQGLVEFGACAVCRWVSPGRHRAQRFRLSPDARRIHSRVGGARARLHGVPGGVGDSQQQVEAIAHLRPAGYTGTPDFLKILLDAAEKMGKDVSSIKRGLVSGAALPSSLRAHLADRGVAVLQSYATAELGVIAYETAALEGMVVNETVIVEIVRPGTGDPVAEGEVGEVVVTSFNVDYPMIRLATGDLSAVLAGRSPCGRTNMRIKGWMGRADQTTKVKGMFVHPGQIAEIAKRHPEIGRVRLSVTREAEQDVMTLAAESAARPSGLEDAVAASLQSVTKLKGRVMLVEPGTLSNDGKIIADERSIG